MFLTGTEFSPLPATNTLSSTVYVEVMWLGFLVTGTLAKLIQVGEGSRSKGGSHTSKKAETQCSLDVDSEDSYLEEPL